MTVRTALVGDREHMPLLGAVGAFAAGLLPAGWLAHRWARRARRAS